MKSSLALCRTKLQVFTLSLILARKKEETVEIYYFDDSYKSDTLDFLNRICKSKGYQFKYFVKKNTFSDLSFIYREFRNKEYSNLYIASLCNGYISLATGLINFVNLITFDDGAANLEKSSFVYQQRESLKRSLFFSLFRSGYSLSDIVSKSSEHYNIFEASLYPYKGYFSKEINISDVFQSSVQLDLNEEFSHLFLSPCYEELFEDPEQGYCNVRDFLKLQLSTSDKVGYIQHPRSSYPTPDLPGLVDLTSNYIAEEIIADLAVGPCSLSLIGFGNTTQAFYINSNKIQNVLLTSNNMKKQYINHFFNKSSNITYFTLDGL
ncbi:glycosyltransferase family 52 [Photobacterium proteolyticum]|nr:glycosyltransferase family 52 [Photobacterium proteolyticum]